MRTLAETTEVHEPLLRTLWQRQLPPQIQAILQTQVRTPLDDLAALADRIIEVSPPTPYSPPSPYPPHIQSISSPLESLTKRLDELLKEITHLKHRNQSHQSRSRDRQDNRHYHTRPNTPSRSRTPSLSRNPDLCWYHDQFGTKAKKCQPPCKGHQGNDHSSS